MFCSLLQKKNERNECQKGNMFSNKVTNTLTIFHLETLREILKTFLAEIYEF